MGKILSLITKKKIKCYKSFNFSKRGYLERIIQREQVNKIHAR